MAELQPQAGRTGVLDRSWEAESDKLLVSVRSLFQDDPRQALTYLPIKQNSPTTGTFETGGHEADTSATGCTEEGEEWK